MRNSRIYKTILFRAAALIAAVFLAGCGRSGVPEGAELIGTGRGILSSDRTILDKGMLFPVRARTGGAIEYLDFASGDRFALCSRTGCSHSDSNCPVWYPSYAAAPYIYDGYLFVFSYDPMTEGWNFMRSRIDGTDRRTAASFLPEDLSADTLSGGITEVYYDAGAAYFVLAGTVWGTDEEPNETHSSLMKIDLASGESRTVREVVPGDQLLGVFEGKAVLSRWSEREPCLSQTEFFDTYGEKGDWDSYYKEWYRENQVYSYVVADLESGDEVIAASVVGETPETDYGYSLEDGCLYYTVGNELRRIRVEKAEDEPVYTEGENLSMQCVAGKYVVLSLLDEAGEKMYGMRLVDTETKTAEPLEGDFLGSYGWVSAYNGSYFFGTCLIGPVYTDYYLPAESFFARSSEGRHIYFQIDA
ncbi:MAG: hypothetical protein UH229_08795 [Lachnospiraceae bacterium]|nr:hypothetical protein [Lachnospiraceae bacterium]